jgi:hypothetical protein
MEFLWNVLNATLAMSVRTESKIVLCSIFAKSLICCRLSSMAVAMGNRAEASQKASLLNIRQEFDGGRLSSKLLLSLTAHSLEADGGI